MWSADILYNVAMIIHLALTHAALPWVYIGFYSKSTKGFG